MSEYLIQGETLTGIADAIRGKTGGTDPVAVSDMAAAIRAIQAGGSTPAAPVGQKDVNFYDYDGTLVASYTLEEAQALNVLPNGPAHDGLVFQGWNWSLEDIKAMTRPVNVGAMYITDDGKTRLYIRVWDKARSNVPLYFSQTIASGVTIDWGDGSAAETLAGTGEVNTAHQYAAAGDYTISLAVADGCTLGLGHASPSYCIMGSPRPAGQVYCNLLQVVNIGANVTSISSYAFASCSSLASITIPDGVTSIGSYAFPYCISLASITIPDGVTSISSYAFASCASLASITIPDGVTSISSYAFQNCYSLASITIPDGVTSIGDFAFASCVSLASITIPDGVTSIGSSAFASCHSLASITIPDGVTSISSYAFDSCVSLASITIPDGVTSISGSAFASCASLASITIPDGVTSIGDFAFINCYGMAEYHLKPTTPPALAKTNAFTGISSDCIIYVPKGSLEDYQAATNWATYANYMREEEEAAA